ncbi:ChaN family lipoprotein [Mucilaginibacter rubeus]|uniref:ChaN family lipoprotein n=1 Tax=Mucilaginibacter rubeus TaxID=2027860 RepID=A0AAE6JD21_9SPHI|nr:MULTISPECIES: ChaN family lipoprotein [Mucilaginibacter]QEM03311.1 ChaN family lipoprotein [Mucilaginibacter rubeus]QEM15929.1 ChaN family lipoprotein [Mucilaginibacter gossypii]QTE41328.1 ChaN family lipoprotein [Mucilaginibacter rubeus]QTE47932.1 ChaN family lipoprotein [Mucilaginibacter rubeus]QTE59325.1 ChaN family lipoprotein [Mucilaginibacter rubeus]
MKLILSILFIFLSAVTIAQELPATHYKIYSTSAQKIITPDDIVNDMANADVLFFGEEHNDSTAHYLEFSLFKKLSEKYPQKTALSMEMFQTDCQLVLNEYLAGLIREKNLVTDARTWPNYKDYKPLVELAKSNHLPVIAANAPTRYTNMVTRGGLDALKQLDAQAKSYLAPLPIDTAAGAYYDKFAKIMGGHASMPGMQIYQSQNLWDATMGWSIAKFLKNHSGFKVLQLNGGFHSEEKLGAVAQLKKYAPKLRVLNIATYMDDSFDKPDWNKLAGMADYIILTDPKLPKTF